MTKVSVYCFYCQILLSALYNGLYFRNSIRCESASPHASLEVSLRHMPQWGLQSHWAWSGLKGGVVLRHAFLN